MIIELTDDEIIEMGKLAILASIPMGMGFLSFRDDLKKEDIELEINGGLYIDYYQGRMVKFSAVRQTGGRWRFNDIISADYQSWIRNYPSYEALAKNAKISLNK